MLKNFLCILLIALIPTLAVAQQPRPEWAFPVTDKIQPEINEDPDKLWTSPGSPLALTREQINDIYNVVDWYPDMYPPMPGIIRHGNPETKVRACGTCHFPTGTGVNEGASVAGLPVDYFIRQINDFRSGNRQGAPSMTAYAKAMTDEEISIAANYFASIKHGAVLKLVETDTVPRTYTARGNKTLRHPDGGTEPLGNRIVQIFEDEDMALNRNPRTISIAYVPKGSIARGKELATTGGGGKTVMCSLCHGQRLQGLGDVPPLAGRHPNYIVRQLWNIQNGVRRSSSDTVMSNDVMVPVVEKLTVDDMLALAACAASLTP